MKTTTMWWIVVPFVWGACVYDLHTRGRPHSLLSARLPKHKLEQRKREWEQWKQQDEEVVSCDIQ